MSLREIPEGRPVLVDANVLLYHARGGFPDITAFLERCSSGRIAGVVTSVIVGEFCHRLMMFEATLAGWAGSNPARQLSRRPETIRGLSQYGGQIRNLLGGGIAFEPVQREDFVLGLELQGRHGLMTNGSLNLAAARRLGVSDIATADQNFDRIAGIAVHKPDLGRGRN
jgi:predicted nucleic acid-binding protein